MDVKKHVAILVGYFVILFVLLVRKRRKPRHIHELRLEREEARDKFMKSLVLNEVCYHIIRMRALTFINLCRLLVIDGDLDPPLMQLWRNK